MPHQNSQPTRTVLVTVHSSCGSPAEAVPSRLTVEFIDRAEAESFASTMSASLKARGRSGVCVVHATALPASALPRLTVTDGHATDPETGEHVLVPDGMTALDIGALLDRYGF